MAWHARGQAGGAGTPPRGRRVLGAAALGAALALAGCGGGEGPGAAAGASEGGGERATRLVETDVEAPEVFQVTEPGLWDGRPSLGGVWVAHPDAADPERVIIRNGETGAFVIGALFRRERDNPGPALQVSSDAAEALGMLAGAPATLNVTALRREEAASPAPTEATAPGVAPVEGLAEAVAEDFPATAEVAAAAAAPAVAPAGGSSAVADAAAAILGGAPAPPAAPLATPEASLLDRPLIQVGLFGEEANAEAAAAGLGAAGLAARVAATTTQGQPAWRVLAGPAATEAERDALLERVRAQGFDDAYPVRD